MPVPKILLVVLALITLISGYYFFAYEKTAYAIRKEDEAMKKEATRIGLEKAREADRKALEANPSVVAPIPLDTTGN